MKKFLVLYRSPMSNMEQMASAKPAQVKAIMAAWDTWMRKNGKAIVDIGAPLGEAKRLGKKVTKAAVVAAGGNVGGYSILQAKSLAAATKALDKHPHFMTPGGSIEVSELMPIPGM